ncbi:MAG TPA: patatin-like phospholipase family protein [Bryobacteraceae bacterium]|nr:patatin-like phospholipase family protein [Bryobacteraceae bacterium]
MKTALVLSAGGMYGAYQAGAWKVLSETFRPDLVVGASIGALNGWAIAGGCPADELIERWLTLEPAAKYRFNVPRSLFGGVLDGGPLRAAIHEIHGSFQPGIEFALVVTDLLKLRPRMIPGAEVTAQHLVASTAIIGVFDQVRLDDGRVYSDGGLLSAVPIWAAAQLGAERIVVLNVLPEPPGIVAKAFVAAMRRVAPARPQHDPGIEIMTVMPEKLLGPVREMLYWTRPNAEAWIRRGEEDAAAFIREHAGRALA